MLSARNFICPSVLLALCLPLATLAQESGTFTTFQAPGTGRKMGSVAINDGGIVAGSYEVALKGRYEGSVRTTDGTITTFRPPQGVPARVTSPVAINQRGIIAGYYTVKGSQVPHGFVRSHGGRFTTFDVPGAIEGTVPCSVNAAGTIAGKYSDASGAHGFVRASDGSIATFDAPGAPDTFAEDIDAVGAVTGFYAGELAYHGFVRTASGGFTTFDPPGSGTDLGQGTISEALNTHGEIAGYFVNSGGDHGYHGFFLAADGSFTTFDVPEAVYGTWVSDMNARGEIAGHYIGAGQVFHAFVRSPHGIVTTIDAPGAGTGPYQGTLIYSGGLNRAGVVAGTYVDAGGAQHGFLWTP